MEHGIGPIKGKIQLADIDPEKVKIAQKLGVDSVYTSEADFRNAVNRMTSSYGADAVIITASTDSNGPVNTAVDIAKFGGKVVVVGVADIHPVRNEMWHKEVEIIVSKAGGPGTFDPFYENKGIDYPVGYVRWTENRNLEEYLRLLHERKVDVNPLISHNFKIEEAEDIYKNMLENKGGPYTGVTFKYPAKTFRAEAVALKNRTPTSARKGKTTADYQSQRLKVGVIGAGLFGRSILLPNLNKIKDIDFNTIATLTGANAHHLAKKFGFQDCATDYKKILANNDIDAVIILTPHSQHAQMII